jgi:hypothetical protein
MNKYLIALSVGGIMEQPEFTYSGYEIIEAKNIREAEQLYNKKNNCSFFYGTCMAEKVDGKISIINKRVTYEKVELLNV